MRETLIRLMEFAENSREVWEDSDNKAYCKGRRDSYESMIREIEEELKNLK